MISRLGRQLEDAFRRYPEEVARFAIIPDAALEALLDFWWDLTKVCRVRAALPVESVPIADFLWVLDVPFGRTAAGPFTHTMGQVIEAPHLFPRGLSRVMAVDLSHPILLCETRTGRRIVMDGFHRVAKASLQCHETIPAVRFPRKAIPAVLAQDGFYGELNRLRDAVPNIVWEARAAARKLIQDAGLPEGWPERSR